MRVVWKEGALGEGGEGVNCSSGMDGSRKIMRLYQVRGRVYSSDRFRCLVGHLIKREREKKEEEWGGGGVGGVEGAGGGIFNRFRSHII